MIGHQLLQIVADETGGRLGIKSLGSFGLTNRCFKKIGWSCRWMVFDVFGLFLMVFFYGFYVFGCFWGVDF